MTFTVQPVADLSVAKTRTAGPDATGATTFRITLANAGTATATNVDVTDVPPAGSSYVSSTPSTGSFTSGSGAWTVASLASGASATLDVTYTVTTTPSVNSAQVTATDQHDPDSSPAEDTLDDTHTRPGRRGAGLDARPRRPVGEQDAGHHAHPHRRHGELGRRGVQRQPPPRPRWWSATCSPPAR